MSWAVVGCGRYGCGSVWVIELDGSITTNCPGCGRRYNRESRARLAEAESREEAVGARTEILKGRP